jgi:hypothetical protein
VGERGRMRVCGMEWSGGKEGKRESKTKREKRLTKKVKK